MVTGKGILIAAAVAAAAAINAAPGAPPARPDLVGLRLPESEALQTLSLASLGMRRLAADIDFVQLMLYYGAPDVNVPGDDDAPPFGPQALAPLPPGVVRYKELGPRAARILALDPKFSYAILFTSGALAFNLDRPEEALGLLSAASRADPGNWMYKAYMAGIAFQKQGDPAQVLHELTPALADPECPVLVKNIVAYINVRLGRRDEAIRIYQDILRSKDPSYRELAEQSLERLGAPVPRTP